jgi:hypothetical protein
MPRPTTKLRTVVLCKGVPPTGRSRVWAFSYGSLAALLGLTKGTVRQMVFQGRLEPADLEQVCLAWLARRNRKEASPEFRLEIARRIVPDMDEETQRRVYAELHAFLGGHDTSRGEQATDPDLFSRPVSGADELASIRRSQLDKRRLPDRDLRAKAEPPRRCGTIHASPTEEIWRCRLKANHSGPCAHPTKKGPRTK